MAVIRNICCTGLFLAQGSADHYCHGDVVFYAVKVWFRFITPLFISRRFPEWTFLNAFFSQCLLLILSVIVVLSIAVPVKAVPLIVVPLIDSPCDN